MLILAAVLFAAPGWWARAAGAAAAAAMDWWRVWLPAGAGLLMLAPAVRSRMAMPARQVPSPPRRDLLVHVAALLAGAVLLLIAVGTLLWQGFGRPNFGTPIAVPGPVVSGTPQPPRPVWTTQNSLDSVKIALSVVAGIGGVVALTVAYRRQRLGEVAEHREHLKLYNERFAKAAEMLGSDQAAVRLAGVYAVAALADDWTEGQQSCIEVLCAYLRMPYTSPPEPEMPTSSSPTGVPARITRARHGLRRSIPRQTSASVPPASRNPIEERQVRHTIIRLIRDHLHPATDHNWQRRHFDLTGATFDGGDLTKIHITSDTYLDFSRAEFSGGEVTFAGATFSGGAVSFAGATFSGGTVSLVSATFSGGTVSFDSATFSGSAVVFRTARFFGSTVSFDSARFSGGAVDLYGVRFSNGFVSFVGATFSGCTVSFDSATFSGGKVTFAGATFSNGVVKFVHMMFLSGSTVDFSYADFSGGIVNFRRPTFSGGTVHFDSATFSGGTVDLYSATFSGGTVSFDSATFSGGTVDLSYSSAPGLKPQFDVFPAGPPPGLRLPADWAAAAVPPPVPTPP